MSASLFALEGSGDGSMVSAKQGDSKRLSGTSGVNNGVHKVRAADIPAAESKPPCSEPELHVVAADHNRSPVRDEHRHEAGRVGMDGVRVAGYRDCRPITWRLLLGVLSDDIAERESALRQQRALYSAWKRECMGPQDPSLPTDRSRDAALLKDIEKDICRTRSELAFFAVGSMAHQWMLRILFVHAKLHPDVGYMQGMNEILAPIVFVYGSDPDEAWALETEADAFFSFQSIIASTKILYAPAPSDPSKSGADLQMSRLMLLLRQHDPALWQHLNSIGVTSDLFSLRWYTTLLGREFPMPATLRVWDALLSDPKRFSLLHYVNCALVRSRRLSLLRLGFAGALKCLQSAPPSNMEVDQLLADAELMRAKDRSVDQARLASGSAAAREVNRS